VGKAFVSQLTPFINSHSVEVGLITTSRRSLVSDGPEGISPSELETYLAGNGDVTSGCSTVEVLDWCLKWKKNDNSAIMIDNTSSMDVASAYPMFLSHGISVITPNKKGFSASLGLWKSIQQCQRSTEFPARGMIYNESTVGAGLPIISTLKDLLATGDTIEKVEGVFSGSLSFLFNKFAPAGGGQGGKWSDEVKMAKELGYTEPDPRDDLNGQDMARKCVILARLCGIQVEGTHAFPVESLIPVELEKCKTADEYMDRLPEFDAEMEKMKKDAEKEGKLVRYLASVDVAKQKLSVSIQKISKDHPVAALQGSVNMVSFYTKNYAGNPLTVMGSG